MLLTCAIVLLPAFQEPVPTADLPRPSVKHVVRDEGCKELASQRKARKQRLQAEISRLEHQLAGLRNELRSVHTWVPPEVSDVRVRTRDKVCDKTSVSDKQSDCNKSDSRSRKSKDSQHDRRSDQAGRLQTLRNDQEARVDRHRVRLRTRHQVLASHID